MQCKQAERPFNPSWGDPRNVGDRGGKKDPLVRLTQNGWEWDKPATPPKEYIRREEMLQYYEAQTGLSLTERGKPWILYPDEGGSGGAATDRAPRGRRTPSPSQATQSQRGTPPARATNAQGGTPGAQGATTDRGPAKTAKSKGNGREMALLTDASGGDSGWLFGAPAAAPAAAPPKPGRGRVGIAAAESDSAPLLRGVTPSDAVRASSSAGVSTPPPVRPVRSGASAKARASADAVDDNKCCKCVIS